MSDDTPNSINIPECWSTLTNMGPVLHYPVTPREEKKREGV